VYTTDKINTRGKKKGWRENEKEHVKRGKHYEQKEIRRGNVSETSITSVATKNHQRRHRHQHPRPLHHPAHLIAMTLNKKTSLV